MALADTLRERVSRRGRTAQVDCGELGAVTVEALSPQECAALGMADGGRALLYAACRELQAAGETLRRERRLFTPDEVIQFVSDGEALAAARTILELSGVNPDSPDSGENRLVPVQESGKDFSEIRLESVQEPDSSGPETLTQGETRLGDVQKPGNQFSEIRPGIVQFPEGAPADGQVSREFFERAAPPQEIPSMGAGSNFEPQNLALSGKNGDFMSPLELSGARAGAREPGTEASEDLHEIESEFPEAAHEIRSEVPPKAAGALHETTSEFRDAVHEIRSEFPERVHEIRSEYDRKGQGRLHETESEFREGLHEIRSEFDENRREPPHEITSELAERVAERLLEGLRRAAAAR